MEELNKVVGAMFGDDWALAVTAAGAYFLVVFHFIGQAKEVKESPRVRSVLWWSKLLSALAASTAAVCLAWYAVADAKGILLTWWGIGMPFFFFGAAVLFLGILKRVAVKDPNNVPLTAQAQPQSCANCG